MKPNPTILALDPGGTTGWCVLSFRPSTFRQERERILDSITYNMTGQIYGAGADDVNERKVIFHILELIKEWPHAVIVIEDFIIRQMSQERSFLSPVRINSAVEYVLWFEGRPPAVKQQPALAKSTCPDERLKEWDLYNPPWMAGQHARDALRHALTAARRAKSDTRLAADWGWRG